MSKTIVCPTCDGFRQVRNYLTDSWESCEECNGTGLKEISKKETKDE